MHVGRDGQLGKHVCDSGLLDTDWCMPLRKIMQIGDPHSCFSFEPCCNKDHARVPNMHKWMVT
jgi:hypothetical protein